MDGTALQSDIGLTQTIADVAASASWDAVPPESRRAARHAVLDWFGVTLAGLDEPLAHILRETYADGRGSSIVGTNLSAAPKDAALINGATSHALDFDDVNIVGHPTAPILPAVLAVAEAEGKSGADALLAYVAGYEAASLIAAQAMPSHYVRGFHSTATLGSFGAAAATARLLDLDAATTAMALGLAGTQAAGLKSMFGTMAKPFHAGKAAANGVMAAELAARGFEARADVLEVDQGFFSTQTDAEASPVGDYVFGSHVRQNLYKYHAACYLTHSMMEALSGLKRDRGFKADDVERVAIHVPKTHLGVCNIEEPRTGLETKFSLRHCAAFVLNGSDTASIRTYSDDAAQDPTLVELRRRVSVIGDLGPGTHARVAVSLASGESLDAGCDVGVPAKDLDREEAALRAKFESLTAP
ncbi:MAG: MmgE/PrpD family protein, partial [Pirellulales bacterium]|nr:MmgE/PrpD family protein [Pirellulales bacterium]